MNTTTAPQPMPRDLPTSIYTGLSTLCLDRSSVWGGLRFVDQAGNAVILERALNEGFFVGREDANCIATLAQRYIEARDLAAK